MLVVKFSDPFLKWLTGDLHIRGSRSVPDPWPTVSFRPGFENQRHGEDFAKSGCHKTAENFFWSRRKKREDFLKPGKNMGDSKLRSKISFKNHRVPLYIT